MTGRCRSSSSGNSRNCPTRLGLADAHTLDTSTGVCLDIPMTSGHTQKLRPKLLRLGEGAEILGVHPETLRRWADSGKVPSVRTPGGERRFRREDIALVYGDQSAS